MMTSTANIETSNASRYLQQLCKHFAHKVDVEFTPQDGTVSLPFGKCRLTVDNGLLVVTATSRKTDLDQLENIIGNHLARFAFRENPEITWQRNTKN